MYGISKSCFLKEARIDLKFFRLIPVIQDTTKFQLHVCKSCLLPKVAEVHYDT